MPRCRHPTGMGTQRTGAQGQEEVRHESPQLMLEMLHECTCALRNLKENHRKRPACKSWEEEQKPPDSEQSGVGIQQTVDMSETREKAL